MRAQAGADLDTLVAQVLDSFVETSGVRRAALALTEGGGRRLRFTASDSDIVVEPDGVAHLAWCHIDAYDDVPLTAVVRTGSPVVGRIDLLAEAFPAFARSQGEKGVLAVAALPLRSGETTLGALMLFYELPQQFGSHHLARLEVSAARVAAELSAVQRSAAGGLLAPEGAAPLDGSGADERGELEEGEEKVFVTVDPVPVSVALARRFARRQLQEWKVDDDVVDTAVLCLSELVTNVVMHATSVARVEVARRATRLTLTVRDSGRRRANHGQDVVAAPLGPDPLVVHGRGLRIVDALAADWGSSTDASGTTVWCSFIL